MKLVSTHLLYALDFTKTGSSYVKQDFKEIL